jgi:hypothetical protein
MQHFVFLAPIVNVRNIRIQKSLNHEWKKKQKTCDGKIQQIEFFFQLKTFNWRVDICSCGLYGILVASEYKARFIPLKGNQHKSSGTESTSIACGRF